MYIGIIYDSHTGDYWYRIEKDIKSVNTALSSIKLPLPVAGIFKDTKNDFVRLDHNFTNHRAELLRIAKMIFHNYLIEYSLASTKGSGLSKYQKRNKQLQ
jgi:hypothetical protein